MPSTALSTLHTYTKRTAHAELTPPLHLHLHLQTGTRRDQAVSVWSWRLAHLIAAECTLATECAMRVVLCVVTRQVSCNPVG